MKKPIKAQPVKTPTKGRKASTYATGREYGQATAAAAKKKR